MSDHPRPTRLSRLLARCYPRELREQYAEDIARFIDDARRDPRNAGNPFSGVAVAATLTKDALTSLIASMRSDAPRPIRRPIPDTSVIANFRSMSMSSFLQDIKYALRGFSRRPAFTVVALLTLTLGIGGTSAMFTLLNSVLLTPLPYPKAEELMYVWGSEGDQNRLDISVLNLEDLRTRNRTFADIGIVRTQSVNLTGSERPDRVIGNFVTAPSLQLLGAKLALGRLFTAEETKIGGGDLVTVLSYETWQSRFGGRADILNQTIILNGKPHVVIGVTAKEFRDPQTCDLYLPITSAPSRSWFDRGNAQVWGIGRLKPGFTREDGERDLRNVAKQIAKEISAPDTKSTIAVADLRESMVGGSRFMIAVLFGGVVAVLLIACVNIANLQLVRASTRQREMSVRAALGANRARLISQTLTESVMLSLAGGILGILVGQIAVKSLVGLMPMAFTLIAPLQLDARVLAFSLVTACITGLLFGLPAALSGMKSNLQESLRARNEEVSTRRISIRNVLVVSELALCIVLLSVAGLFTRSMQSIYQVDAGYIGTNVLTAEFRLPAVKYDDNLKVRQFMTTALANLRNTPGVVDAALVDAVPLGGGSGSVSYIPEGKTYTPEGAPSTGFITVSDGYFRTLQIPQIAGRDFDSHDNMSSERVAVVNKIFADREWPKENPIGKTIRLQMKPEITVRVIGVVGAIKQYTITERAQPQIFVSKEQNTGIFTGVAMRTTGDAASMGNALRAAIWAVDRDQPVWKVRTLQSLIDRDLAGSKSFVGIFSVFALLALLLGTIGVYGVMSFVVQQRSREMGIRLALGARGDQVLRLVLRGGFEVITVAVVIGVAGALAAGRYVQSRLFNVGAADPATMVGVPVILAIVGLLACWLPARRAARVDPAVTLRSE